MTRGSATCEGSRTSAASARPPSSPRSSLHRQRASTLIGSPVMRQRGFTLIELLVVIAIIALLVSILMPSLQRATYEARKVYCAGSQRNVLIATNLYAEDHNGKYPPAPSHWYHRVKLGPYEAQTMGVLLRDGYLPVQKDLFFCPSGEASWNWQSWPHLQRCILDNPGTNAQAYITYAARFTEIDRYRQLTLETAGDHAPLLADYVYDAKNVWGSGSNFALYWTSGSKQAHQAQGLNVGYFDTSVKFLRFEPMEWCGGAAWLGMYNVHYRNGNVWYWARRQYGL